MKHNFIFLLSLVFIFCAACSIPTMVLKHDNQIENRYESLGRIKIELFEDRRLEEERIEGETAVNSLSPQIWSGSTSPEIMHFFQNSMMEEAERTQAFEVSEQTELVLSGYVTSMNVSRRVTLWRYIGPVAFFIGLFTIELPKTKTGEEGEFTPFLIGSAIWLISTFLDNPVLSATVEFRARVKRNGEQVFEKDIKLIEEDNYSSWTEWGWEDVSEKAAVVLDRAITKSIKQLFEELKAEKESLGRQKANGRQSRDER